MQVEVDVKCMQTNFGGHDLFGFRVMAPFCLPSKMAKISLRTMGYSPWGSKNLIDWNWLKKFMQVQVEVDLKCMQINFGGCGLSGFGVMATFVCLQKWPKFPFQTVDYSPNYIQVVYRLQ